MNSDTVKALALQYWRHIRQPPVVMLEDNGRDVSCVRNRYLIETEVKVSIADLKKDIEKGKHYKIRKLLGLPLAGVHSDYESRPQLIAKYESIEFIKRYFYVRQFYFAVPVELKEKALAVIEELYPYAGQSWTLCKAGGL